jgi:hypothetical protein
MASRLTVVNRTAAVMAIGFGAFMTALLVISWTGVVVNYNTISEPVNGDLL